VPEKEATARIKINRLLEAAGWRFLPDGDQPANIRLEPSVTITSSDLAAHGAPGPADRIAVPGLHRIPRLRRHAPRTGQEPIMIIRNETPGDIPAIFEITRLAFENHPHSVHTEQFIVNALRAAGALAVSLVAEVDGKVVGHIAFSPAAVSDGSEGWYGLGPVSVLPEFQKRGVGGALVRQGLARLAALGAGGCVLVGDPRYYARFGFGNMPGLAYEGVPQEYVLALPLGKTQARGVVAFHPAFSAKS